MKRIIVFLISLILIISSFSFTASAADSDIIFTFIYNDRSFSNTPILSDSFIHDTIYTGFNNEYDLNLSSSFDNEIYLEYISFSKISTSDEVNITFDITYSFKYDYKGTTYRYALHYVHTIVYSSNADTIDTIYDGFTSKDYSFDEYIYYNLPLTDLSDIEVGFIGSDVDVDAFGDTIFRVIDTNGEVIISEVLSHRDIYNSLDNVTNPERLLFEYRINNSGYHKAYLYTYNNDLTDVFYTSNIPDFYYNLLNACSFNGESKVNFDYYGEGLFVQKAINLYNTYTIDLYVGGENYEALGSIGMNLYNYNGTTVYGSKIIRGSYIDYSIKIKKTDNTLDFYLNIDGGSEYFQYTISYNLIENIEYLGLSFTKNNPYPDISFDLNFDSDIVVLYEGKFIPSGTFDNLNFYIVEASEFEVIKAEVSKEFLDESKKQNTQLTNSTAQLSDKMQEFKDVGSETTTNVINNLKVVMNGEGATEGKEILNVLFDIPLVIELMTISLSMVLLGYVLFGKKG